MTSPADTIREALANPRTKWCSRCEADALNDPCVCTEWDNAAALAALTELEADRDRLAAELRYIHARVRSAGAALAAPDTPPEPTGPGDVTAAPDGECNGCKWGWERYKNPQGIWLHRNATDTVGAICTGAPDTPPTEPCRCVYPAKCFCATPDTPPDA